MTFLWSLPNLSAMVWIVALSHEHICLLENDFFCMLIVLLSTCSPCIKAVVKFCRLYHSRLLSLQADNMIAWSMNEVESLKHAFTIGESCQDHHDMEQLVTGTKDVEFPAMKSFRYLLQVSDCSVSVQYWKCIKKIPTFIAYREAPRTFKTGVMSTQEIPICWLCVSHPFSKIPCITGTVVKMARLPNVAALSGRRKGARKRGWKVDIEQRIDNTDNCLTLVAAGYRGVSSDQCPVSTLKHMMTLKAIED